METGEKKKENWQSRKADGKEKELKGENKASETERARERERESPVYEPIIALHHQTKTSINFW